MAKKDGQVGNGENNLPAKRTRLSRVKRTLFTGFGKAKKGATSMLRDESFYSSVTRGSSSRLSDDLILIVVETVVDAGIDRASPHVKNWWGRTGRPFLSARGRWIRRKLGRGTADKAYIEDNKKVVAAVAAKALADKRMGPDQTHDLDVDDVEGIRRAIAKLDDKQSAILTQIMAENPDMLNKSSLNDLVGELEKDGQVVIEPTRRSRRGIARVWKKQ